MYVLYFPFGKIILKEKNKESDIDEMLGKSINITKVTL